MLYYYFITNYVYNKGFPKLKAIFVPTSFLLSLSTNNQTARFSKFHRNLEYQEPSMYIRKGYTNLACTPLINLDYLVLPEEGLKFRKEVY